MSSSAALKTEPVKAKRAASRASEAAPSQQPKLSVVAGIAPAQRRHLGVIMMVILGLVIAIGGPLLVSARTTFEAIETSPGTGSGPRPHHHLASGTGKGRITRKH